MEIFDQQRYLVDLAPYVCKDAPPFVARPWPISIRRERVDLSKEAAIKLLAANAATDLILYVNWPIDHVLYGCNRSRAPGPEVADPFGSRLRVETRLRLEHASDHARGTKPALFSRARVDHTLR